MVHVKTEERICREKGRDMTYCKRGYFRWGKISRKCWQDISRGGNFHDSTHIFFIKTYWFYFRVGVIFAEKSKSRKTRKLPHAKISTFTVVLWQKPLHRQQNPKSNVTTHKRRQNFDNTTIADRLRTVSWCNNSHPTGVVKPVYGIPTFPLTATAV